MDANKINPRLYAQSSGGECAIETCFRVFQIKQFIQVKDEQSVKILYNRDGKIKSVDVKVVDKKIGVKGEISYEKLNLTHWLIKETTQEEKNKLFFVFAKRDPWSPQNLYKKLPASIPKMFEQRFDHNFCLDPSQCEIMASLINKNLFNF